jgi:hypothetical protein
MFSDEWQENLAGMCNHILVIHFGARAIFKNLSRRSAQREGGRGGVT